MFMYKLLKKKNKDSLTNFADLIKIYSKSITLHGDSCLATAYQIKTKNYRTKLQCP